MNALRDRIQQRTQRMELDKMSFEGMQEWLAVLDPDLKAKQGKGKQAQVLKEAADQAKEKKAAKGSLDAKEEPAAPEAGARE